jgi:hypothetical protein
MTSLRQERHMRIALRVASSFTRASMMIFSMPPLP